MTGETGHVWIVGAGPGDPGLITVAGARAIAEADVILYDALAAPALLRGARPGAEVEYVGKRSASHQLPQEEMNALIVKHAKAGKRVVRLKGGDPFVFGRGGEEALACRAAGIPFTIVPGITSAIAAPAYAGIPVTHRQVSANFLVLTGNDATNASGGHIDWKAAARAETLVMLMGVANLESNVASLVAAGKDPATPAAAVRWGTRPDQLAVYATLGTLTQAVAEADLTSPAVTVVGPVAGLAKDLAWFDPGPLAGKRVVVTRARAQASDLAAKFEALGALVVEAPVIGVHLREDGLRLAEGVSSRWDWILFTSANGVEAFFRQLRRAGHDTRALSTTKIASIGSATSEVLARFGVTPDFVPSKATSEVLAAELPPIDGAHILLPASALSDSRLENALRARGGQVEQIVVYDNVLEPLDDERRREVLEADAITFTSASTAKNLREALGEATLPATAKLVSIGPQTSDAVRAAFGRLDAEAASPSLDALVEATRETLR
jgi:uroporphyrinogen III methyltransferase / synthase